MSESELAEFVEGVATRHRVPGVAVGVWADGHASWVCHGVTSVRNPLPVQPDTLFVAGSVAKTFTATALMCLVADGRVELTAPVRRYVPELVLPDESAAEQMTVLQLLNHTAGLDWRMRVQTGDGDDALARYVAAMAQSPLIAAPGQRASYSQVGFNLAGRIIEKVTGLSFEQAVSKLLLEPLRLEHACYDPGEALTQRYAVGHNLGADGTLSVARQWKDTRANNPGGDIAISVADLLRWGTFHLGDPAARGGTLPAADLRRMREPTSKLIGSSLGDALGICWFLRDIDGLRTAGHAGSGNGQFAELLLVPDRNFVVAVMSNAGPDGGMAVNRAVLGWALERHLGVVQCDPEPMPYDPARAAEVAGRYQNDMMVIDIADDGATVTIECGLKPEVRAATGTELPPDLAPAGLGLLPGDEYIVTSGGLTGQRGFFSRAATGQITAADLGGRQFTRTAP